jgi:hypothetical protein
MGTDLREDARWYAGSQERIGVVRKISGSRSSLGRGELLEHSTKAPATRYAYTDRLIRKSDNITFLRDDVWQAYSLYARDGRR